MKWQPRTIDILSIIYTLGYFLTLWIAFYKPFPQENRDVLNVLLGVLTMIMAKVVDSYFTKDAANSATSTTIRAMKSDPNSAAELDDRSVIPAVLSTRKEVQ